MRTRRHRLHSSSCFFFSTQLVIKNNKTKLRESTDESSPQRELTTKRIENVDCFDGDTELNNNSISLAQIEEKNELMKECNIRHVAIKIVKKIIIK